MAQFCIPRAHSINRAGNKGSWPPFRPQGFKGMSNVAHSHGHWAVHLETFTSRKRLLPPVRGRIRPWATLHSNDACIGQRHRSKHTKWASLSRQGHIHADHPVLYANHLRKSGLIEHINEEHGMKFFSDHHTEVSCVADVLIAEYYAAAIKTEAATSK